MKELKIIKNELEQLNNSISENLKSSIKFITTVGNYITQNSGKKLRPILLILIAKIFKTNSLQHVIKLACAIEFIHIATLLHDDVIDQTNIRRKKKSVNKKWNNKTAILVGDYLYSRAFQLILKIKNNKILEILADATNTIAEGEILQLIKQEKIKPAFKECMKIIEKKTAKLFEVSALLGAKLSKYKNKKKLEINIRKYGYHFGIAYQLLNDLQDCDIMRQKKEKKFNDLKEKKITIPLLYCYIKLENEKKNYLKEKIGKNITKQDAKILYNFLVESKAFDSTRKLINSHLNKALQALQKIKLKNIIYLKKLIYYVFKIKSRGGETGRRDRLKIC